MENSSKELQIRIQPSLHLKFKEICEKNYKTVSGTIKELIVKFIKENSKNEIN